MEIPKPKNNDKRARTRVTVITENGFKAHGVTAYTHDELMSLLEANTPWLIFQTVELKEGSGAVNYSYSAETICIQRAKIVAWAITGIEGTNIGIQGTVLPSASLAGS